ncbi:MAG: vitamin K epoxide reductase family protein, partial [Thermodesulfobacteriota bacterium]
MSKKQSLYSFFDWKGITIVVLSILGIILSLYLTLNFYYGSEFSYCLTGTDCDLVKKSAYSKIFGIPVSILGLFGYAAIIAATIISLSKKNKWNILFIFSSLGFSFSVYLTYLELFIINAVCSYCIISAVIITLLLILIVMKKAIMSPKPSFARSLVLFLFISAAVFAGAYSI